MAENVDKELRSDRIFGSTLIKSKVIAFIPKCLMKGGENRETEFEEMHIAWVWEELHERFGFPLKEWKKQFAEYLDKQPSGRSEVVGAFFRFGYECINPILNQILCRRPGYPSWNNLCDYIVKKKR